MTELDARHTAIIQVAIHAPTAAMDIPERGQTHCPQQMPLWTI